MSELLYSAEKIGAAAEALKTGAPVKVRLKSAASHFLRSSRAAMPDDETRDLWERIRLLYTSGEEPPLTGSAHVSIDSLTEVEAKVGEHRIAMLDALLTAHIAKL